MSFSLLKVKKILNTNNYSCSRSSKQLHKIYTITQTEKFFIFFIIKDIEHKTKNKIFQNLPIFNRITLHTHIKSTLTGERGEKQGNYINSQYTQFLLLFLFLSLKH